MKDLASQCSATCGVCRPCAGHVPAVCRPCAGHGARPRVAVQRHLQCAAHAPEHCGSVRGAACAPHRQPLPVALALPARPSACLSSSLVRPLFPPPHPSSLLPLFCLVLGLSPSLPVVLTFTRSRAVCLLGAGLEKLVVPAGAHPSSATADAFADCGVVVLKDVFDAQVCAHCRRQPLHGCLIDIDHMVTVAGCWHARAPAVVNRTAIALQGWGWYWRTAFTLQR